MSEKSNEYHILVKGVIMQQDFVIMEQNEDVPKNKIEIELIGFKKNLRSGLIQAMKTDETFAELIIDAADYFRENGKNFEYNKK
jgi:hypothetical protein